MTTEWLSCSSRSTTFLPMKPRPPRTTQFRWPPLSARSACLDAHASTTLETAFSSTIRRSRPAVECRKLPENVTGANLGIDEFAAVLRIIPDLNPSGKNEKDVGGRILGRQKLAPSRRSSGAIRTAPRGSPFRLTWGPGRGRPRPSSAGLTWVSGSGCGSWPKSRSWPRSAGSNSG